MKACLTRSLDANLSLTWGDGAALGALPSLANTGTFVAFEIRS